MTENFKELRRQIQKSKKEGLRLKEVVDMFNFDENNDELMKLMKCSSKTMDELKSSVGTKSANWYNTYSGRYWKLNYMQITALAKCLELPLKTVQQAIETDIKKQI